MKNSFCLVILSAFFSFSGFAQHDAPGCTDSPMFNRMPYMAIGGCSSQYGDMNIPIGNRQADKKEGLKTTILYNYQLEEASAPSFLKIVKNYEHTIAETGGRRLYYNQAAGVATLFTRSAGKDVWVVLKDYSGIGSGNFEMNILEVEARK